MRALVARRCAVHDECFGITYMLVLKVPSHRDVVL